MRYAEKHTLYKRVAAILKTRTTDSSYLKSCTRARKSQTSKPKRKEERGRRRAEDDMIQWGTRQQAAAWPVWDPLPGVWVCRLRREEGTMASARRYRAYAQNRQTARLPDSPHAWTSFQPASRSSALCILRRLANQLGANLLSDGTLWCGIWNLAYLPPAHRSFPIKPSTLGLLFSPRRTAI